MTQPPRRHARSAMEVAPVQAAEPHHARRACDVISRAHRAIHRDGWRLRHPPRLRRSGCAGAAAPALTPKHSRRSRRQVAAVSLLAHRPPQSAPATLLSSLVPAANRHGTVARVLVAVRTPRSEPVSYSLTVRTPLSLSKTQVAATCATAVQRQAGL